jgi:RNA polymerase sigma-70 factor (ECF subfamily)
VNKTSSINTEAEKLHIEVSDLDLIRRAQKKDLHAFEELFNRYQRRIYNFILQMVRNDADAADLTQETFVRVYNSLPRLRTPEAFPSWIHRVALNLCRDHAKRGRLQSISIDQPLDGEEGDLNLEIPDYSMNPEKVLASKELEKRVQEAVASLAPDHRAVVMMHHIDGMDLVNIAEVMGCSVGTIKSRLARARDMLKRKLGGYIEV